MKNKKILLLLLALMFVATASAKFVQEVELKDGTVLVGYVYRQQPSRFVVFHADHVRKDPKSQFLEHDKNYTLQWNDIKYIRRSSESEKQWCNDKVTLNDGTVYTGQIEEQELGVSMTMRLNGTGEKVVVSNNEIKLSEKVPANAGDDLWTDRQYVNQLRLTDNTIHEGLIVLQYRGAKTSECYVELLHGSGYKERIYLPDITEYIIQLR